MGYILILLFVFANVVKGACSKKISARVRTMGENVNVSIARSFVCLPVSLLLLCMGGQALAVSPPAAAVCALAGICMALNYAVWLAALDRGAYVLVSASNNAGFLVATVAGALFFGERITLWRALALLCILAALFFMLRFQVKGIGKAPTRTDLLLLLTVFLSQGLSMTTQKWFLLIAPHASSAVYTFYTFLFSCLALLLVRPFFRAGTSGVQHVKSLGSLTPYVLLIGTALFFATFFQARAAYYLDAVVLYPLSSALSLTGGALMAWIVFHEKPSRDAAVGMLLVFLALVLSKY